MDTFTTVKLKKFTDRIILSWIPYGALSVAKISPSRLIIEIFCKGCAKALKEVQILKHLSQLPACDSHYSKEELGIFRKAATKRSMNKKSNDTTLPREQRNTLKKQR